MRARGAAVIVVLGGDGTVRAAAARRAATSRCCRCPPAPTTPSRRCGRPPSPGRPPALLATGRVAAADVTLPHQGAARRRGRRARDRAGRRLRLHRRARRARRRCGSPRPCASSTAPSPSRTRSACPASPGCCTRVGRTDPHGVAVRLAIPPPRRDRARPVAPGVVAADRACAEAGPLPAGDAAARSRVDRGTVAVDGEREIAFGPATPVTVTLAHDGPRVLDVRAALAAAAAAAGSSSASPSHPSCRRSDEGSTVPRPRRHPHRRRTRAAPSGRGR